MQKCAKCNQEATVHVTEVYEGTGKVKEFHLCAEHARERCPDRIGFTFGKAGSGSPMTNPAELAARFVADLEGTGYTVRADKECVIVTRNGAPQIAIRIEPPEFREAVRGWLVMKGISRQPDEVNAVAAAIQSLLRGPT